MQSAAEHPLLGRCVSCQMSAPVPLVGAEGA